MGIFLAVRSVLSRAGKFIFVLVAVLCSFPVQAQFDGDDLLLMIPVIVAKSRQSGSPAAPPPSPVPAPGPAGLSALETALLNAHNQARASSRRCGGVLRRAVPALRWNALLARAARVHSADMNRTGVFDHEGSDGSSSATRATRQGYNWTAVGENIAAGYPTVSSVVNALLDSPGHCNNIMGSRYVDIGAAKVGRYWTMVFARPR